VAALALIVCLILFLLSARAKSASTMIDREWPGSVAKVWPGSLSHSVYDRV
jgi:steroid 5-alpha reductase family enzyme